MEMSGQLHAQAVFIPDKRFLYTKLGGPNFSHSGKEKNTNASTSIQIQADQSVTCNIRNELDVLKIYTQNCSGNTKINVIISAVNNGRLCQYANFYWKNVSNKPFKIPYNTFVSSYLT
jgi:hypothetical protein